MEKWTDWQIWQASHVGKELRQYLEQETQPREKTGDKQLRIRLFDRLMGRAIDLLSSTEVAPLTAKEIKDLIYPDSQSIPLPASGSGKVKIDTNLRSRKADLKHSLEKFASSGRGKQLPMSVHVVEGKWALSVEKQACAMKRFWEPYFNCDCVTIVYAESVFFRGGGDIRAFVRHMDVNDKESIPAIQAHCELPPGWVTQKGGRQFVSAGDCVSDLPKA